MKKTLAIVLALAMCVALFAGCRVNHVKIEQIIKMMLPYFVVIIICLMLVTYIPWLTMSLPTAVGLVS